MIYNLEYVLCNENAKPPKYDHRCDSGMALYSMIDIEIMPHETVKIPTGIKFNIPEGCEIQCRSRSGMAKNGIVVAQGVGTVDEPYTGELFVLLRNVNDDRRVYIKTGMKVAQAVLVELPDVALSEITEDQLKETSRGNGCLGSTGDY
jgi:dUTP pyrophosphatase